MNDNKQRLGQLLKTLRGRQFPDAGLRRVAQQVDIDYTHLFRIETGQYVPQDDKLTRLLAYYDASVAEKLEAFNLARLSASYSEVLTNFADTYGGDRLKEVLYRHANPHTQTNHEHPA